MSIYIVGGPEEPAATGTTGADGTFDLDLGTAAHTGMLVRVMVTQGNVALGAILPARAVVRGAYALQDGTQTFYADVDVRTTMVAVLLREELAEFGPQLRMAGERTLASFQGTLEQAVIASDAVINKMGAEFKVQLMTQFAAYWHSGVLPAPLAYQFDIAAINAVDDLVYLVHRMNLALAQEGIKEAQAAVDNPKPLDLGNGVTITPPGAAGSSATTTTASSSGGGSGGGGGSGNGSNGSDSAATDAAASTAVQVRGSLTPAPGNLEAPNLTALEVHFRNGATVFDLTFSQPIFGWEDTTCYVFAAAANPSASGSPTAVRSLTDGVEHLPFAQVSVQGDVDPKVVHVIVPDSESTTFVPSSATAVHIRIKPGLKNQDGVALDTSGASFTMPVG